MTLPEIADVVGGTVHPAGASTAVAGAAYVDSRSPVPDGLFVAVVGERVDGHDHAAGAHAVLGSRPTDAPTVVVDDPVAALGRLARHVADRLVAEHGTRLLALTGSQGKTGTKDYLAAVLAHAHGADAVVATAGNGNNELGVPLTVLRAGAGTRFLVVEMGARGVGHIAYLCGVAPPQVAAVLNVGSAHVGEFGGREAIARAKGEIVEALPPSGTAVLNADDPFTAAMVTRTGAPVLGFGQDDGRADAAAVRWSDVVLDDLGRPSFSLLHDGDRAPVALRQSGLHQVANAAAAAAMALAVDVPLDVVAAGLSGAEAASPWRMEVTERGDGLVVVNDAYNANPESVAAALRALADIGAARASRTVAVLGEMKELGSEHDAGHAAVGAEAARLGVDVVLVVGDAASAVADGAATGADDAPEVVRTAGREEAATWLRHNATAADVVLVKASRGAALESVADGLLADESAGARPGPEAEGSTR